MSHDKSDNKICRIYGKKKKMENVKQVVRKWNN
jgi:hypothetical protein